MLIQNVQYNSSAIEPLASEFRPEGPLGYDFKYWTDGTMQDGEYVEYDFSTKVTANKTLYAYYKLENLSAANCFKDGNTLTGEVILPYITTSSSGYKESQGDGRIMPGHTYLIAVKDSFMNTFYVVNFGKIKMPSSTNQVDVYVKSGFQVGSSFYNAILELMEHQGMIAVRLRLDGQTSYLSKDIIYKEIAV